MTKAALHFRLRDGSRTFVPALSDLHSVREILNRDRVWAAYALADLSPGFVEHCEWYAPASQSALLLLYRGFEPPIVFASGEPRDIVPLFAEINAPEISLQVRPEIITAMSGIYAPTELLEMHRMVVASDGFTPVPLDDVTTISEGDAAAVAALYADGHQRGEGPTFFHESMLRQGTFRGVWDGGALLSIAGTHVCSEEEGVFAIGNVYTRSDARGRGLGARVTSAVVTHALNLGVQTIVLNVGRGNRAALRAYQRLGFEIYCDFVEGTARRRS